MSLPETKGEAAETLSSKEDRKLAHSDRSDLEAEKREPSLRRAGQKRKRLEPKEAEENHSDRLGERAYVDSTNADDEVEDGDELARALELEMELEMNVDSEKEAEIPENQGKPGRTRLTDSPEQHEEVDMDDILQSPGAMSPATATDMTPNASQEGVAVILSPAQRPPLGSTPSSVNNLTPASVSSGRFRLKRLARATSGLSEERDKTPSQAPTPTVRTPALDTANMVDPMVLHEAQMPSSTSFKNETLSTPGTPASSLLRDELASRARTALSPAIGLGLQSTGSGITPNSSPRVEFDLSQSVPSPKTPKPVSTGAASASVAATGWQPPPIRSASSFNPYDDEDDESDDDEEEEDEEEDDDDDDDDDLDDFAAQLDMSLAESGTPVEQAEPPSAPSGSTAVNRKTKKGGDRSAGPRNAGGAALSSSHGPTRGKMNGNESSSASKPSQARARQRKAYGLGGRREEEEALEDSD
ncbi:hypothetical protein IE53DRAFT_359683 [Violaceomyces palustris]|uniref:Uncharacterized protein n=1 Tax=Violaceomyces palustris TaxID=1673888 RepID=A0ACD0P749_9BASI|nr:hypothetical protein IE53DRAFT_359683 [Violaceomyces palustris]